jgi:TPP-dependent pyruvate/acetoin dehydrogenase alpha subunit
VVFLCENNQYTEWMRTEDITAGRIADRAHAFGVPGLQVDGNDVFAVREVVDAAVERARGGEGPSFVEAVTYRHLAHNEGEEAFSGVYRPPDEVEAWKKRDPVASLRRKLEEELGVQPVELETLERRERELVDAAVEEAESAPLPAPEEALDDLFAERTR